MLKFSLALAIILSSFYISFCQAQNTLSACATNCSETAGSQAGCNPGQLNQPNCVCTNAAFFGAASGCVWESCSSDDALTAENFWLGVCSAYAASSSASVASASSSVSPSSSSTGYGGHPSSSPTTTSNGYTFGGSTTGPGGSQTTSTPSGGSSSASSSGPSSSTSSNLAASMPTHAAALIAGGIGAMVAVFV